MRSGRRRVFFTRHRYPGVLFPPGPSILREFILDICPRFTYRAGGLSLQKSVLLVQGTGILLVRYDLERSPAGGLLRLKPFLAYRGYHDLARENRSHPQPNGRDRKRFYDRTLRGYAAPRHPDRPCHPASLPSPLWYRPFRVYRGAGAGLRLAGGSLPPGGHRGSSRTGGHGDPPASCEPSGEEPAALWDAELARRREELAATEAGRSALDGRPPEATDDETRIAGPVPIRHRTETAEAQERRHSGAERADGFTATTGSFSLPCSARDASFSSRTPSGRPADHRRLPLVRELGQGHPDLAARPRLLLGPDRGRDRDPHRNRPPRAGGAPPQLLLRGRKTRGLQHRRQLASLLLGRPGAPPDHGRCRSDPRALLARDDTDHPPFHGRDALRNRDGRPGPPPRRRRTDRPHLDGRDRGRQCRSHPGTDIPWRSTPSGTTRSALPEPAGAIRRSGMVIRRPIIARIRRLLSGDLLDSRKAAIWATFSATASSTPPSGRISSSPSRSPSRPSTPPSRRASSGRSGRSSSPPAGSGPSRPPIRPTGAATGASGAERDAAYHQGTVWPWLLGPFGEAALKVAEDREEEKEISRTYLRTFLQNHLAEAGIGSVSEVFDGDAPHRPGGCIAQAWSVAELIRLFRSCGNEAVPPRLYRPGTPKGFTFGRKYDRMLLLSHAAVPDVSPSF